MPDLTFQSIEPRDLDDINALWRAAATADPCEVAVLREKILDDDGVLPSMRLEARERHRLAGICVGALRDNSGDRRGFVKLLATHPEARQRGIGSELLRRVEYELIAAGATSVRIAESAPNYLTPGMDLLNGLTIRFLQRRGYASIGEACNMRVDLRAPGLEAAMRAACDLSQIESTTVRRATDGDLLAVERFILSHWAAWLQEVQHAFCNSPISLHLAIRDRPTSSGDVVGFAAYDANNRGTGWFGPMGTDPACQGKGIGRVLLLKCLGDMHCQGRSTATIPWVGPLGFYQRHVDAEVDRRFIRLEKIIPPFATKC